MSIKFSICTKHCNATSTQVAAPANLFQLRRKVLWLALLVFTLGSIVMPAFAQTISANLSGYVNDPEGAVIPDASVVLTNQTNKADKRTAKSNSAGYFTFNSVPAGTYQVEVQRQGFSSFLEKDIQLHPADNISLTNIKLKVGEIQTVVSVNASQASPSIASAAALSRFR